MTEKNDISTIDETCPDFGALERILLERISELKSRISELESGNARLIAEVEKLTAINSNMDADSANLSDMRDELDDLAKQYNEERFDRLERLLGRYVEMYEEMKDRLTKYDD